MKRYPGLRSLCIVILIFIPSLLFTSCQKAKVVDSFLAPDLGGLAFDGTYIWVEGVGHSVIWQLDTSGHIINFFDRPGTGGGGLAFDGTHLWLADFYDDVDKDNMIYKLDKEMNVVDSFDTALVAWPIDIASDGTHLWLADVFAENIYKLDTTGNLIDVFDAPCEYPMGLSFDGNYLWLSALEGVMGLIGLYKLDTSGNVMDSFYGPGLYFPTGLACDGSHLWLLVLDMKGDPTLYKLDISK